MMCGIRHGMLIAALGLAVLTSAVTPVMAKGPAVMIVYGSPLAKMVVLSNARENAQFAFATRDGLSIMYSHLKGRPFLHVAMFWGAEWTQYKRHHQRLTRLRTVRANQFGRFYPAYGSAPALFAFDSIPGPYTSLVRRVGPAGLAVLARHGVPIRLPLKTAARLSR